MRRRCGSTLLVSPVACMKHLVSVLLREAVHGRVVFLRSVLDLELVTRNLLLTAKLQLLSHGEGLVWVFRPLPWPRKACQAVRLSVSSRVNPQLALADSPGPLLELEHLTPDFRLVLRPNDGGCQHQVAWTSSRMFAPLTLFPSHRPLPRSLAGAPELQTSSEARGSYTREVARKHLQTKPFLVSLHLSSKVGVITLCFEPLTVQPVVLGDLPSYLRLNPHLAACSSSWLGRLGTGD